LHALLLGRILRPTTTADLPEKQGLLPSNRIKARMIRQRKKIIVKKAVKLTAQITVPIILIPLIRDPWVNSIVTHLIVIKGGRKMPGLITIILNDMR
jgi:hypothetical protein